MDADPPSGTAAGDYAYTIRAVGNGEDESDTGTVTVTDGTDPPDPCANASVTAPDLSAPLGGDDSGAATHSGFPSGSGAWTVTEQPDVGTVSVSSNGTVSWDAPSSQPSPGDSTDYAVQYARGGCTAEAGGTVTVEGVVDPCANARVFALFPPFSIAQGESDDFEFSATGFPGSGGSWSTPTVSNFGPLDGVVTSSDGTVTVDVGDAARTGIVFTIEITFTQGGCSATGSASFSVVGARRSGHSPAIGDIPNRFLDNVPQAGTWFVPLEIADGMTAKASAGSGAQVSLSSDTVMQISTSGLIDVGDTFDVTVTATDTEDATSVRTFTFTISD